MDSEKNQSTRESMLSKIKAALDSHKIPQPFPEVDNIDDSVYTKSIMTLQDEFSKNFIALGGGYFFCESIERAFKKIQHLQEQHHWKKIFTNRVDWLQQLDDNITDSIITLADIHDDSADVCITDVEGLIARTGSFIISSKQHLGRVSTIFYPIHIAIAFTNQLVPDIKDALKSLQDKYNHQLPSMISFQTGPSRTADIEKTLVTGVHGPKEVYCLLIHNELY
jgi:L-lactate dehydrogenase complex protein LldG